MKNQFVKGMYHGVPIMLGYLSVSFGFGLQAVRLGLSALAAVGISMSNLTSAGQLAGITIIAAGGSLVEMAIAQLVINLRYALMGFSLSQRLGPSFNTTHRLLVSFGITDEIFAVASSRPEPLAPSYMYGLIFTPFIGWNLGTLLGAIAGNLMPAAVSDAMGLMLYGMFIAIIIPPAKRNYRVLVVILLSASLSILFTFVFTAVSSGFAVIICSVVASVICALIFPYTEEDNRRDSETRAAQKADRKAVRKGEKA